MIYEHFISSDDIAQLFAKMQEKNEKKKEYLIFSNELSLL